MIDFQYSSKVIQGYIDQFYIDRCSVDGTDHLRGMSYVMTNEVIKCLILISYFS